MKLIVTEKNIAAQKIASLLSDTKPKADKVYNTPVYRFIIDGQDCVTVGLKGHIEEVTFPDELSYSKRRGWVGICANGETVKAQIPRSFEKPPWTTKRKPWTADGLILKSWKIPTLPYLCYAPIIKVPKEKEIIRSLKSLAKKADEAIIATDFDREGELIG
ncbi:MAG: toprim domain-containing protein, partial [Coriobacteriales bacterium]|nr:toprim domain-containing protein [Coriobacteriales bacterium]